MIRTSILAACVLGLTALTASTAAAQTPSPRACDAARRSGHPLAGCARRVRPTPSPVTPPTRPRTSPRVAVPAEPAVAVPGMPGLITIYFDFDSARIRPEATAALDEAVTAWRQLGDNNVGIVVSGHTDDRGTAAYNMALSRRVAASVRGYLVAHGVPARAIAVRAYGGTRPAATGNDESVWARNRRAEIAFVPRESAR